MKSNKFRKISSASSFTNTHANIKYLFKLIFVLHLLNINIKASCMEAVNKTLFSQGMVYKY